MSDDYAEYLKALQAKEDLIEDIANQLTDLELLPMPEEIKEVRRVELTKEMLRQRRSLVQSLASSTDKNGKI